MGRKERVYGVFISDGMQINYVGLGIAGAGFLPMNYSLYGDMKSELRMNWSNAALLAVL